MLILGVDPGSAATGFGVIRKEGAASAYVNSGTARASTKLSHSKKLWTIHARLEEVIREHKPSVMVVESLFHSVNSQSLMKLSQVRGVVLLLGELHGMEIFEYAPMEIKKGLTGYGRADKEQVSFMVSKILGLPPIKSSDEGDALAMALYHSHLCLPERAVS